MYVFTAILFQKGFKGLGLGYAFWTLQEQFSHP